jgi:uncharacterized protein YdhG (YjbR/CyaY superfamily)
MRTARTIDDHIRQFPASTQKLLRQIRRTIRATAPGAVETISYGIPTFDLNGAHLIHFAGYAHHIGLYPGSLAIEVFRKELSRYDTSRGTVQLPLDRPLPLALIRRIVKHRVEREDPFATLAAPARRALMNAKIRSLTSLAKRTEPQIAQLHGMGPNALKSLKGMLKKEGLRLKKT